MFQPYKFADLIATPVVTPDPFTLASLIAWLEKQDPHKNYDWDCTDGTCLLGQYSAAHNGPHHYYEQSGQFARTIDGHSGLGRTTTAGQIACKEPWTFGAALERARAVQS